MGEVPGPEPGPTWGQGASWPSVLACIQDAKPCLPASGTLLLCSASHPQTLLPGRVGMSLRTCEPLGVSVLFLCDYPQGPTTAVVM